MSVAGDTPATKKEDRTMIRSLILAAALFVPFGAAAETTATYEIDSAHSSAGFAVTHMLVTKVRGTLGKVTGTVVIDEADPTKSTVEATIDVAGIDTRDAKRDEHLRADDFFDVANHPTITFRSKSVEKVSDSQWKATGDLTIRGNTKEVVLDVEGTPTPVTDPWGNTKLGGAATTRIDRQDFGVSWSKTLDAGGLVVGNEVDVTIDIQLVKKK